MGTFECHFTGSGGFALFRAAKTETSLEAQHARGADCSTVGGQHVSHVAGKMVA
ncbi:MAG: hypothetical protein ABSE75_10250 [Acidimicrobiales bacterium]